MTDRTIKHPTSTSYLKAVLEGKLQECAEADEGPKSMRALAKTLELSPSFLSQVLRGQKFASPRTMVRIGRKLHLDSRETEYLCLLSQRDTADTEDLRLAYESRLDDLTTTFEPNQLAVDRFNAIKNWYHVPIMEMTDLSGFEFTPRNISRRLGITEVEATRAIDRLIRLGLLTKSEDGTYSRATFNSIFRSTVRNEAFAFFLKQMMELGRQALDEQPIAERYFGTQTFCLDAAGVEEARLLSREFLQRVGALAEKCKNRTQTYQCNLQLFNLTDGRLKPAFKQPGVF